MRLRQIALVVLALTALASARAAAQFESTVASGFGTFSAPQPFAGTRTVDVRVRESEPRSLEALTIRNLDLSGSSVTTIGARVYDATLQRLVACAEVTVASTSSSHEQRVPIVAELAVGRSYRIGFYVVGSPANAATMRFYQPNVWGYSDDEGLFVVEAAHGGAPDSLPTQPSSCVPQLVISSIQVQTISVPIDQTPPPPLISSTPSTDATLGFDFTVLGRGHREVRGVLVQGATAAAGSVLGVRLYENNATRSLVFAHTAPLLTATTPANIIPIVTSGAMLRPGVNYRFAIHLQSAVAVTLGVTTPSGLPYVDSQRAIRVNSLHADSGDVFPSGPSSVVPAVVLFTARANFGTNRNTGIAAGGVATPILTSCSTPQIGEPLRLDVRNGGAGPATLLLAIDAAPAQLPALGLSIMSGVVVDTPAIPLAAGAGTLAIPVPLDFALIGTSLASQAFVFDFTSPADLPLSHSDILVSTIGG